MDKVSENIEAVETNEEFRICPACGYQRGFHVSFMPNGSDKPERLVPICPSCGGRYEIGNLLSNSPDKPGDDKDV